VQYLSHIGATPPSPKFSSGDITQKLQISFRIAEDKEGVEYDDVELDLLMIKPMPEILPIKGQRIKFHYPGIKTLCLRCYRPGHPKWECQRKYKTNWLEYVMKFFQSDEVTEDMLGSWVDTLKEFHPEFQAIIPPFSKQHKDLRRNLDKNKRAAKRESKKPEDPKPKRGRGRGFAHNTYQRQEQYQAQTQFPYYTQQFPGQLPLAYPPQLAYDPAPYQARGRGRGRGQGRGRGRGRGQSPFSSYMGNKNGLFYTDLH